MPMQSQWPPPTRMAVAMVQAVARSVVRQRAEYHKPIEAKHMAGATNATMCRKKASGLTPPKTIAISQTGINHHKKLRTLQRAPHHLAIMISPVVSVVVMRLVSV